MRFFESLKDKMRILKNKWFKCIAILLIVVLAIWGVWSLLFLKTDDQKIVEKSRAELLRIINSNDSNDAKMKKLKTLAKEVVAGTENTKSAGAAEYDGALNRFQTTITEAELVQNIHQALQTLSMIDACKISARSWGIAIIAAMASVISAGTSYVIARRPKADAAI